MRCRVTVFGVVQEAKYISDGELEFTDGGFELKYFVDGDNCTLCYDGKTLCQSRRGEVSLDLTFEEGRETNCTLGEGGLCGEFTIFTKDISVEKTDGKLNIKLKYDCGGETNNFYLTAENFQEKK